MNCIPFLKHSNANTWLKFRHDYYMLNCNLWEVLIFLILTLAAPACNSPANKKISPEDAKKGENLFNSSGCPQCHSLTGEVRYGPSLINIFDRDVTVMKEGKIRFVRVNREYIIRSIKSPESEKLIDYQNRKMPPVNLSDEDISQIADYLIYINQQ